MASNEKFVPIACLVVGLLLGYVGGQMFAGKATTNTEGIKARLTELGTLPVQPTEVRQLQGSIKAINGNTLTVVLAYPRDPFGDPSLDERMVTIDNNTKVTFMVPKDEEAFKKELAVYQKKMSAMKPGTPGDLVNMPLPPQMSEQKEGDISSFEIGKTVAITTTDNVREQKSFTAITIDVTPSALVIAGGVNTAAGAVPLPPPAPVGTSAVSFTPPPPPAPVGGVSSPASSPPPPAAPPVGSTATSPSGYVPPPAPPPAQ